MCRSGARLGICLGLTVVVAWGAPVGAARGEGSSHQVVPAHGAPFAGELVAVAADGRLTFRSAGDERQLGMAELVLWGAPVEPNGSAQILTADGSLLIGDVQRIDGERLVVSSDVFDDVRLAVEQVRGVILGAPADRHRRDRLADRIRTATGDRDRLILANGDELTGTLAEWNVEQVGFETDVGRINVEPEKITAVIFSPALIEAPPAQGKTWLVGSSDGSLLAARSLAVDAVAARLTLVGGVELSTASPEELVSLQPLGGSVTYLSDLKPHGFRHVPYLNLPWPLKADRNVAGSRLRCGGRLYSKGLGVHSASRVTYRLKKPYRHFAAELAIDDSAGRKGSVVFRVFVHRDGKWQKAYASAVVRGGMPPTPMSVDLSGAKAIALLVDFADHGDERDHADWLNARLVK